MITIHQSWQDKPGHTLDPWHWSETPFPGFRGVGYNYQAFLPVGQKFVPHLISGSFCTNFCRLENTPKGPLLIPCEQQKDEKIMLITAIGGDRGEISRIEVRDAEILLLKEPNLLKMPHKRKGPTAHLVARILDENGYVMTESGENCCGTGTIEIYLWQDQFQMKSEDYPDFLTRLDSGSFNLDTGTALSFFRL